MVVCVATVISVIVCVAIKCQRAFSCELTPSMSRPATINLVTSGSACPFVIVETSRGVSFIFEYLACVCNKMLADMQRRCVLAGPQLLEEVIPALEKMHQQPSALHTEASDAARKQGEGLP